ncbi:MAG: DUF7391 family protein, partial [Pyrinomonadaceae bacterium]
DLELPSGHTALVRAVGMETFITQGLVPNDLLGVITEGLDINSGKKDEKLKQLEKDKLLNTLVEDQEKLASLFALVDAVTIKCVVKPEVEAPPENSEDRDPDILYVDEIDMEDKFFIFNFTVGGTRQVGEFREELASVVDSTSHVKKSVRPTKRTGGISKPRTRK